jgi:hypothetical protein
VRGSCDAQDWHVDFAGSSVYYHIVRGAKVGLVVIAMGEI